MAGIHLSLFKASSSRPSTLPAPSAYRGATTINDVAQNLSYWDSIHLEIDSHLKKALPIREPMSVFEPLHHLTFAPPRTSASALCVAACELVGGNREDAIVAASTIHLMHAAIYTHDHLLLSDQEVHPKHVIPHKFSSNIELLISDGMLPFGMELLAGSMDPAINNADKILKVIVEITQAIGAQGMLVDNKDFEVKFDRSNGQRSRQLHGCGAACGAILGGGSEEEVERLKRYGVYAGKLIGLLNEMGIEEGVKMDLAEKWRALALKELEYFDSNKIEQISTFVTV